jgi:hypothetical protein
MLQVRKILIAHLPNLTQRRAPKPVLLLLRLHHKLAPFLLAGLLHPHFPPTHASLSTDEKNLFYHLTPDSANPRPLGAVCSGSMDFVWISCTRSTSELSKVKSTRIPLFRELDHNDFAVFCERHGVLKVGEQPEHESSTEVRIRYLCQLLINIPSCN